MKSDTFNRLEHSCFVYMCSYTHGGGVCIFEIIPILCFQPLEIDRFAYRRIEVVYTVKCFYMSTVLGYLFGCTPFQSVFPNPFRWFETRSARWVWFEFVLNKRLAFGRHVDVTYRSSALPLKGGWLVCILCIWPSRALLAWWKWKTNFS